MIFFSLLSLVSASPTALAQSTGDSISYGIPGGGDIFQFGSIPADGIPAGANNPGCKSDKPPVVLVHGTFENQNNNWMTLAPLLAASGRCPWVFNFGGSPGIPLISQAQGAGDITSSAKTLSGFVDQVLSTTGTKKVDIVGHSQGGMMPHVYIRDMNGASKVSKFIALSPSNSGTNVQGLTNIIAGLPIASQLVNMQCNACSQQIVGSEFMTNLHQKGLTVPGVEYTVISTTQDEVVTPYTSQQLPGATNIVIQDGCPQNQVGHMGISFDKRSLGFVMNALGVKTTPVCEATTDAL